MSKKTEQDIIAEAIRSFVRESEQPKPVLSVQSGKKKHQFAVHLHVDGNHVGTYEKDLKTGRGIIEVSPEHRSKGYGKLLTLKAIHVATQRGHNFPEDESRTKAFEGTLESLEGAGHIVSHEGNLHMTEDGLNHLNTSAKHS